MHSNPHINWGGFNISDTWKAARVRGVAREPFTTCLVLQFQWWTARRTTTLPDPLPGPSGSTGEPGTDPFWSGRGPTAAGAVNSWKGETAEARGEVTVCQMYVNGCKIDYAFITSNNVSDTRISFDICGSVLVLTASCGFSSACCHFRTEIVSVFDCRGYLSNYVSRYYPAQADPTCCCMSRMLAFLVCWHGLDINISNIRQVRQPWGRAIVTTTNMAATNTDTN